jgi:hypothetical protein
MIVSHKYRFIFIKTRKVGGTSVEIALSKFLGSDDIVTPIVPEDERLRSTLGYNGPRNCWLPVGDMAHEIAALRPAGCRYLRKLVMHRKWPLKFYNHIPASEVKKAIGAEAWSSYLKFSIERNPFDKVCSFYFWDRKRGGAAEKMSFREFVLCGRGADVSDFDLYSISQVPRMDRIARYENLAAELDDISAELGLPERLSCTLESINAKAGIRQSGTVDDFYDSETRRMIEMQFAREIAFFGYRFPEPCDAAKFREMVI